MDKDKSNKLDKDKTDNPLIWGPQRPKKLKSGYSGDFM